MVMFISQTQLLSLISSTCVKMCIGSTCNPNAGEAETARPGALWPTSLTYLTSSMFSWRPCLKLRRHPTSTFDFHTCMHAHTHKHAHTCTYVHIYKHAHMHTHVPTHTQEERNWHHGLIIKVYIKSSNYNSSKILRVTEEKQIKGISPCIEQKHYFLSSILKIQQRSSDMLATIITLAHLLNPHIVRNQ